MRSLFGSMLPFLSAEPLLRRAMQVQQRPPIGVMRIYFGEAKLLPPAPPPVPTKRQRRRLRGKAKARAK